MDPAILVIGAVCPAVAMLLAWPLIKLLRRSGRRHDWLRGRLGSAPPEIWQRASREQRRRVWRAVSRGAGVSDPDDVPVALAFIDFYTSWKEQRKRLLAELVALAFLLPVLFVGGWRRYEVLVWLSSWRCRC